jgi:hypothetical protein
MAARRATVQLRPHARTVYAQVLGGLLMAGGEPYFAVQPGAGGDFWMRRGLGVRVGADYQQWITNGEAFQVFRIHAGLSSRWERANNT